MKHKQNGSARQLRVLFSLIMFSILAAACLLGVGAFWLNQKYSFFRLSSLNAIFFVALTSIVLGTVISALAGKWILSPIAKVSKASKRIAAGDFSVRLKETSRIWEIADINRSFNAMAEELSMTKTLRSDFVSSVSHEFKTPLNAIEGYAMLLQDESLSPAEKQEYLNNILKSTGRLSQLVGNILMLSKLENSVIPTQPTLFRLDEQIRQAVLALESRWSQKGLELDVELEDVTIEGVEPLLGRVWANLVDNAVKFSPEGGHISLSLHKENGKAVFCIADSGPGISPKAQGHIFDKFYQEDTSHRSEGNGLGLSIVKRIAELHGGSVCVVSEIGQGAAFTVILPLPKEA